MNLLETLTSSFETAIVTSVNRGFYYFTSTTMHDVSSLDTVQNKYQNNIFRSFQNTVKKFESQDSAQTSFSFSSGQMFLF